MAMAMGMGMAMGMYMCEQNHTVLYSFNNDSNVLPNLIHTHTVT